MLLVVSEENLHHLLELELLSISTKPLKVMGLMDQVLSAHLRLVLGNLELILMFILEHKEELLDKVEEVEMVVREIVEIKEVKEQHLVLVFNTPLIFGTMAS